MAAHSSEKTRAGSGARALRIELMLERNVHAPALARKEIAKRCAELQLGGSLCQSLILLVSEVVSNAVRHSGGACDAPIKLVASFGSETIRVTVTDAGDGFTPQPRDPESTRDGYGLYLLEKVSSRWGVESRGDTKVWFELSR